MSLVLSAVGARAKTGDKHTAAAWSLALNALQAMQRILPASFPFLPRDEASLELFQRARGMDPACTLDECLMHESISLMDAAAQRDLGREVLRAYVALDKDRQDLAAMGRRWGTITGEGSSGKRDKWGILIIIFWDLSHMIPLAIFIVFVFLAVRGRHDGARGHARGCAAQRPPPQLQRQQEHDQPDRGHLLPSPDL